MHRFQPYILLFIITIFGFILRFAWTGVGPGGLNRDEAALAYNGYLLSETGMDEWGRTYPVGLESFGDYKLIGYPLILSSLFQAIALADFSDLYVRLPSILAGSLLIPLAYIFSLRNGVSKKWSILFAFFIATTPIFIFYSRFAYEANVALTLFVSAYLLLIQKSHHAHTRIILQTLGLLLFYFSLCMYNTPLLLAPTLLLLVVSNNRGNKLRSKLFPLLGVVCVTLFFILQTQSLLQQKKGITIFNDATIQSQYPTYRNSFSGPVQSLLGNDKVYYLRIISTHFIETFSPKFLVISGGSHPWHALEGYGHLFVPQYIIIGFGTLFLFIAVTRQLVSVISTSNIKKLLESEFVLFVALVLSLLPAIITVDAPHATRSLFPIFLLICIGILGMQKFFLNQTVQKFSHKKYLRACLLLLVVFSQIFLSIQYVNQLKNSHRSQISSSIYPGLEQFLTDNSDLLSNGSHTVLDTSGYLYIIFAWYSRMPADRFFDSITRLEKDSIGFSFGASVGDFTFESDPKKLPAQYIYYSDDSWKFKS